MQNAVHSLTSAFILCLYACGCSQHLVAPRVPGLPAKQLQSQRAWLYIEAQNQISPESLKVLANISEERLYEKPAGVSLRGLLKRVYGIDSKAFESQFLSLNPSLPTGRAFTEQALQVHLFGAPIFSAATRTVESRYDPSCAQGDPSCTSVPYRVGSALLKLKPEYSGLAGDEVSAGLVRNDPTILTAHAGGDYLLITSLPETLCDVSSGNAISPYDLLKSLNFNAERVKRLATVRIAVIDSGIAGAVSSDGSISWDQRFTFWSNPQQGSRDCGLDDEIGCNLLTQTGNVIDDATAAEHFGHGTHVAGLSTAYSTTESGIPRDRFQLMVLKVAKENGKIDADALDRALDYAIKSHARVINVSAAGHLGQHLKPALSHMLPDQILVAASGNEGKPLEQLEDRFPAGLSHDYPNNMISVAAVDKVGMWAEFSNCSADLVTIAAPGVDVISTFPGGIVRPMCGTSQSAPLVSLAAALLMADNQDFKGAEVRVRLEASSDFRSSLNGKVKWAGMLDIPKALYWKTDVLQTKDGVLHPGTIKRFWVELDSQDSSINPDNIANITFDLDERHQDRLLLYGEGNAFLTEKRGTIQNVDGIILKDSDGVNKPFRPQEISDIVFRHKFIPQ